MLTIGLFTVLGLVMYTYYLGCDPVEAKLITKKDQVSVFLNSNEILHLPPLKHTKFLHAIYNYVLAVSSTIHDADIGSLTWVTWTFYCQHL